MCHLTALKIWDQVLCRALCVEVPDVVATTLATTTTRARGVMWVLCRDVVHGFSELQK